MVIRRRQSEKKRNVVKGISTMDKEDQKVIKFAIMDAIVISSSLAIAAALAVFLVVRFF